MSSQHQGQPGPTGGGGAAEALAAIDAALEALREVDLSALNAADTATFVRHLEAAGRRVDATRIAHVDTIDRAGLHHRDVHRTAAVMVRHVCAVPDVEARRRVRAAVALRHLPVAAAAFRAGDIGLDHVTRLARLWANPRVRERIGEVEQAFVTIACEAPYALFAEAVDAWERRIDRDGTIDRDSILETARFTRQFDHTWRGEMRFSSARGVVISEIFDHFVQAELRADWQTARASHGDAAAPEHLPRTAAQRSADAFYAMCLAAASAPPDAPGPRLEILLTMSYQEFVAEADALARTNAGQPGAGRHGHHPPVRHAEPRPGVPEPHHRPPPDETDLVSRCSTVDGVPVDPWDVAAFATHAHLRRVVIGAAGTVIDLGRSTRCFTGSARLAALLHSPRCVWAGCATPTRRCHIDHVTPYAEGGATDAANAAPLCGPHNRAKNRGFHTWRDPTGRWHTVRPDGTEV